MTDESTVFDAAFEYNMNGMSFEAAAEAADYDDKRDARIAELEAALKWYSSHVADCRKLGTVGDVARGKLDRDGGTKAREALKAKT